MKQARLQIHKSSEQMTLSVFKDDLKNVKSVV